jgi:heptosyltransferase-2
VLVVVSNQAGVARGVFTEADVEAVNERIEATLSQKTGLERVIERFYYCPYHPDGTVEAYRGEHPWRKPAPGMLVAARRELGLDLPVSWVVGDQPRDVAAGEAVGCRTVLIGTDAANVSDAAEIILARDALEAPRLGADLRTLLVVMPSWVGDTVMATPVLRAARESLPEARIVGAVRPGLEAVLAGTPWLDDVVVCETKTLLGPARCARLVRRLCGRPEAALLLPNSFRSALVARMAGCAARLGYVRGGRGPLLTHGLDPPPRRHPVPAIDYYARLAEWALPDASIERRMELVATDDDRSEARRLLEGVGRPFAVLNPGANKPPKRWPPERFGALAVELAERHKHAVAVTGAPGEQAIARAVVDASEGRAVDLVARGVSLAGLKGVLDEASLLVTNDTGPRHMALALGTATVVLFGPTDPRWTTTGSPLDVAVVAGPFLPPELVADEHPERCAIDRISVGDVLAACRTHLV